MTAHAAQVSDVPYWLLEVPYDNDPDAVQWLSEQLQEFASGVFDICRVKNGEERLRLALERSNTARELLNKSWQLRREHPRIIPGGEALEWLYGIYQVFGSRQGVKLYQRLYDELVERARGTGPLSSSNSSRLKLLWLHIGTYYPIDLYEVLGTMGAEIVYEEYNHPFWSPLETGDPYCALARKIMANHNIGPIERRSTAVKQMVKDYDIDGVIHFNHWGCRQSAGALRILRDALMEEDVPLLALDGDCIDRREYHPGQVRTRLEGFIEMLK